LFNNFDIYASLGLLDAEFSTYSSFAHIDAIPPLPVDLSGRNVAHAPTYQAVLGADYFLTDQLSLNFELEAKDDFFFSDRHNLKSDPYEIANVRVNYQTLNWGISVYINNVGNKDIKTRGFGSFGNDPRTFYARGNYFQFAAPRVAGVVFSWEFN